ncbi:MAG: hypothetical protein ABIM88_01235 [candidate division WOR-3 bacterium]
MRRKYILVYLLVSLVPSLAAAAVIWKLGPIHERQGLIWIAFLIALIGSFGSEYLAKWLKKRLHGTIPEDSLNFNLVLLTVALIVLFFNSSALLASFLGGNKLFAWLLILIGLVDSALAARSVMKAGSR